MAMNVSQETTCKWQNHSSVSNKYVSQALSKENDTNNEKYTLVNS